MSKDKDETQVQGIARAVLRYLSAHPEAKDTLRGIAHWWLEHERTHRLLEDVERALDLLLTHDLVLETRRQGAPPYYQLNLQQSESISRMIDE